ncbi:MAG: MBL fold metallo-hydrolase [Victivallales bacterium]|jgi:glyoxylase-like metal-dependent hydrolase (beta-lactamase superfamily II)|nr:MBL fold metallo-hydrolase [Victivallales bacterium]
MRIETIPVGVIQTNCYLVLPNQSTALYIIDPGDDAQEIAKLAAQFNYQSCAVLLTHAHVDHIAALGELQRLLNPQYVFLRTPDHALYASRDNALLPWLPPAKNLPAITGRADERDFSVISLPGHTPGGSGFLFPGNPAALFVGDTLFAGSIGRTDLPGGDTKALLDAICSHLLTLPDDLIVYPGHGPATTIGKERKNNPFLQGLHDEKR